MQRLDKITPFNVLCVAPEDTSRKLCSNYHADKLWPLVGNFISVTHPLEGMAKLQQHRFDVIYAAEFQGSSLDFERDVIRKQAKLPKESKYTDLSFWKYILKDHDNYENYRKSILVSVTYWDTPISNVKTQLKNSGLSLVVIAPTSVGTYRHALHDLRHLRQRHTAGD